METITKLVQNLEEQKDNLELEKNKLLERISDLEYEKNNILLNLKVEKLKSQLFATICAKLNNIDVNDLVTINSDSVKIKTFDNLDIPIIVSDFVNEQKFYFSKPSKKQKKSLTKKIFRKAVKKDLIDEDLPTIQEEKINKIEQYMENIIRQNKLDYSYNETMEKIRLSFKELEKTKSSYNKDLENIAINRSKLMVQIPMNDYINLIKEHNKKIAEIFKNDNKKIGRSLTSLEKRLIYFPKYYMEPLIVDDLQKYKIALLVNMPYPKRYVPFSMSDLLSHLQNHSLCFLTLKENLERVLCNPYSYSNIVYVDKKDKYSFYILESVENEKRKWKLEMRLYKFANDLSNNLITFCRTFFRRIYNDAHNHNDYVQNSMTEEFQQLLQNMILLCSQKSFCVLLQDIIIEKCLLNPTQLDRFDIQSDDKQHKKMFEKEVDSDEDIISMLKSLFDKISEEDLDRLKYY